MVSKDDGIMIGRDNTESERMLRRVRCYIRPPDREQGGESISKPSYFLKAPRMLRNFENSRSSY